MIFRFFPFFGDLFWKRKIFDKRKFEKHSPNGKKIKLIIGTCINEFNVGLVLTKGQFMS
jgi:hypothetical protein